MKDIEINFKKDLNNIHEVPLLAQKNIYYNCSECQSVIEIMKLDEEYIEFKCCNNHNIKMKIKKYLDKIKEFKDRMELNDDTFLNDRYAISIKRNIYHFD